VRPKLDRGPPGFKGHAARRRRGHAKLCARPGVGLVLQNPGARAMTYTRFAAMIATSTLVMFGLMYLNTYAWDHLRFSETRTYMAVLMGAAMAIVMLGFMRSMYPSRRVNLAIFAGAALVFAGALFLVRSQATVDQVSYMRAMIPHHSIAILTSERAEITDPRVRSLADEIIEAQRREIAEMEALIEELAAR
jgi:drug/metabolite transporter (DMT)-like permease